MDLCVISYKNGTVQSFHSDPEQFSIAGQTFFLYTPKTGMFCVEGMIGIRAVMVYEKMEFKEQFTKIEEGVIESLEYFDFEEYLSERDVFPSILAAYHALGK